MAESKTGGPAFPFNAGEFGIEPSPGMTLRDWFAGQIVSQIAGTVPLTGTDGYFGPARKGSPVHQEAVDRQISETARRAYAIADAMLAERSK